MAQEEKENSKPAMLIKNPQGGGGGERLRGESKSPADAGNRVKSQIGGQLGFTRCKGDEGGKIQ